MNLVQLGKLHGNVLDAGCEPNRNARYLASLGYKVVRIDISERAISKAIDKTSSEKSNVNFNQRDFSRLNEFKGHFDTVIDIGCFHSILNSDHEPYAASLSHVCHSDSSVFLRAFSETNKSRYRRWQGHKRYSLPYKRQCQKAFFINDWKIEDIKEEKSSFIFP